MKQKTKKILAMVLLVCILITLPIRPMEAKAESGDREYEYTYDGYSVSYSIINEWNGGMQAEVSVKNTSDEAVKNWGIEFDAGGTVVNIWNACVKTNEGTWYIIKNSTYNSEIPAGCSASVGFVGVKEAGTQVVFDGYELTEIVAYSGDGSNGSAEDVTEPSTEASDENGTEEGFGGDGNSTLGNSETEAASDGSCESTESGTQEIITGEMTTEESTVESVIDYTRDSDGDGLFDYLEMEYGCDSENPDSDGDGLPDGYEVFYLGTSPSERDSDGNGTEDGDEDLDGDRLSNRYEYDNGLSVMSVDTDGDGLTDYEEVMAYGTNPLERDSDKDGISDGNEVILGLSPILCDTDGDGTDDGSEKIRQTAEYGFDDCDEIFKVAVEMECSGYIGENTSINDMGGIDMLSSDVAGIVGNPIEITSTAEFDTAVIKFYYNPDRTGETKPEKLAVMWYDEENNTYVVLEDSVVDEENHCVSYTTTHFSTYMLVDSEEWYRAWKNAPDYILNTDGYTDVICVVDYTAGVPEDTFSQAKELAGWFQDNLEFGGSQIKDRLAVIGYPYDNVNDIALSSSKSGTMLWKNLIQTLFIIILQT